MRYKSAGRLLPAWLCFLLLAGCGTPVTHYYVLNTVPGKPLQQAAVTTVSIRQVEVPRYLDRPRFVSRDADNHLRIAEYHQWGGRLRENLAGILGDNLSERLASVAVSTAPFPGSVAADISLLVDVRQFERMADGYVHLNVRWQLQRIGQPSDNHVEQLRSSAAVQATDYSAMAAAMSRLLGQLADRMAASIAALPEPAEQ